MNAVFLPIWVTLAAGLFVGGNEVRHVVDGRAKLEAAALPPAASYDVAVTLNVTPEPFHMNRLQNIGTMAAASGSTVVLRRVPASRLTTLAREPWVASLAAAKS